MDLQQKAQGVSGTEQLQGQLPGEIAEHVANHQGCTGSMFGGLKKMIIEIMKTKRSLRQELLLNYTTRKRPGRGFFCSEQGPAKEDVAFPDQSKPDAIWCC